LATSIRDRVEGSNINRCKVEQRDRDSRSTTSLSSVSRAGSTEVVKSQPPQRCCGGQSTQATQARADSGSQEHECSIAADRGALFWRLGRIANCVLNSCSQDRLRQEVEKIDGGRITALK
jgi:hypothetical protein